MQVDYQKAKTEAEKILKNNYIERTKDMPIRPDKIASTYGINVKYIDFADEYKNVAGYVDIEKNTIYVNDNDPANRQTFTIAHELGHILLHKDELEKGNHDIAILLRLPIGNNEDNPLEKEANCFAANLLVPTKFLCEYKDITNTSSLSKIFLVSEDVIRFRLKYEYRK